MIAHLNWKYIYDCIPEIPLNDYGWSNQLLAFSEEENIWFEAVYHFSNGVFYTLDHTPLSNITHFCEEIPFPLKSWLGKKDQYDEDGHLENMEIGDWIVTKNGEIIKISADDQENLKYWMISRYATKEEVLKYKKEQNGSKES